MIVMNKKCKNCGGQIEVRTQRKYIVCPYCGTHTPFKDFEFTDIVWEASIYAGVKRWTDCPACRYPGMYLGPEGKKWKCPQCNFSIDDKEKELGVFWFCDECEAFLNVQDGFDVKNGEWKCSECGAVNDVSEGNII